MGNKLVKVCVVGLGEIGLPVAQYVSDKGLEVFGYDINPDKVAHASQTGALKATTIWQDIPPTDIYIVCVTTSQTETGPNLSPVFEVSKQIAQTAKPTTLVAIESTIIPGTTQKIYIDIFHRKIRLVHAPHRYWADEPVKHGVNQLRVIGAVNQESLDAGMKFYTETVGIQMHQCASAEIAEMCKITENSHRYLQIAFAEELKMMCQKINLDFEELREACNTKWNVDIPKAMQGIGRHCLPKDIKYVTYITPSTMLESAMTVDKQYRQWLTQQK